MSPEHRGNICVSLLTKVKNSTPEVANCAMTQVRSLEDIGHDHEIISSYSHGRWLSRTATYFRTYIITHNLMTYIHPIILIYRHQYDILFYGFRPKHVPIWRMHQTRFFITFKTSLRWMPKFVNTIEDDSWVMNGCLLKHPNNYRFLQNSDFNPRTVNKKQQVIRWYSMVLLWPVFDIVIHWYF